MSKEIVILNPKSMEDSIDSMKVSMLLKDNGKYAINISYLDSEKILYEKEFDSEKDSRLEYYNILRIADDIQKLINSREIDQAKQKTAELFTKFDKPKSRTELIRHEMLLNTDKFKVIKTAEENSKLKYSIEEILKAIDRTSEFELRESLFGEDEYIDTPGDWYIEINERPDETPDIVEYMRRNMGEREFNRLIEWIKNNSDKVNKFMETRKTVKVSYRTFKQGGYFVLIRNIKPEDINKVIAELEQYPHISIVKEAFGEKATEETDTEKKGEYVFISEEEAAADPSKVKFYVVSMIIYDKDLLAWKQRKEVAGYPIKVLKAFGGIVKIAQPLEKPTIEEILKERPWVVKRIKRYPPGYAEGFKTAPYAKDPRVEKSIEKINELLDSINIANEEIERIQTEALEKVMPDIEKIEESKRMTCEKIQQEANELAQVLQISKETLLNIKENLAVLIKYGTDREEVKLTKEWVLNKLNEIYPEAVKQMSDAIDGLKSQAPLIVEKILEIIQKQASDEQEINVFKQIKGWKFFESIVNFFKNLVNKFKSVLSGINNFAVELEKRINMISER